MVSLSILGVLHYVKNDVPLIMSHLVPVLPRPGKKWGLCPTNSGFVHAQIDFAILQDSTLKPIHYLIKHEEVLPHQKNESNPILDDYGTDQFSIRINDTGNNFIVKPLNSFSFKSVTPFRQKSKHLSKRKRNLLINNLFYSMILISQVTMKNMNTL